MPYTPQEKKDFAIKDAKYAIGMAMGNAFQKSVDLVIASGDINENFEDTVKAIKGLRDEFFKDNQARIQEEFDKWLEENEPKIDEALGIRRDDEVSPL